MIFAVKLEDINGRHRIGRAVAQHLKVKPCHGFDARKTSCDFANATANGVMDAGLMY